jgi:hypothetical protein
MSADPIFYPNKKVITEGFSVGSQTLIDDRVFIESLEHLNELLDSGAPFRWPRGLTVYYLPTKQIYVWLPKDNALVGLLAEDFTYPEDIIVNGFSYSAISYNFYPVSTGTGSNFTHYIGEEFGGGIIFHLWRDPATNLEKGLIMSLNDLGTVAWSSVTGSLVSATSTWNGLANTNLIIAQHGGGGSSAAKLCRDFNGGSFDDWYLPAVDEINILFNNRFTTNPSLSSAGGTQIEFNLISTPTYWTSNETDATNSVIYTLNTGSTGSVLKNALRRVRAIRKF